jgi:hypothetical protein
VKQAHFEAVAQATILTKPELEKLERQEAVGPEDQLNIEKTQAADFLALADVTPENVAFCIQYRSLILQLEVLLHGQDLAIHRDLDALTRQTQWGHGFMPFDQPFYELKRFVRDRLGIMPYLDPDATWSNDDLQPLGDMVRGHRQQVQQILGFTVPEDEQHASNGWIFQMICQQLGLKVQSQRRGPRGAQERYFSLNREHYQQLMDIVDRRQVRRLAAMARLESAVEAEMVVTPAGLKQTERGNYGIALTEFDRSPDDQLEKREAQPVKLPSNRFIGHQAFAMISDRVRRQVDMAIGGLRLALPI